MTWMMGLVLLLVGSAAVAAEDVPCPPGLQEAAQAMGQTMQQEQEAIRASSLASPEGVEETVQFDLGAHACHRGPGQSYRVFGAPACRPADAAGLVPVRYPYELQYRKALTLDELFAEEWKEGSDGLQQVQFQLEGGRWIPVARKEVLLQLEGNRAGGAGHPGAAQPPPLIPAPGRQPPR
ncbi:MAG TPA: hypothetical protein VK997_08660 [Deferrisomatales bacterium]|nr:hypothetical protein [Deferrisomatales bacterium]